MSYIKGHVVLSGVHFEYDPWLLDDNDPFLAPCIPPLQASQAQRKKLMSYLWNLLCLEY